MEINDLNEKANSFKSCLSLELADFSNIFLQSNAIGDARSHIPRKIEKNEKKSVRINRFVKINVFLLIK